METKNLGPYFGQEYIDLILEIAAMENVILGDGKKYKVFTKGSILFVERGSQLATYGPNSIHERYCRNRDGVICFKQHTNGGSGSMGGSTKLIPLQKA